MLLPVVLGLVLACLLGGGWLRDMRPESGTRYCVGDSSGSIDIWLHAPAGSEPVRDGAVSLRTAEGTFRISVSLTRKDDRRARSLRTITPNEVVGGPTPALITIRLSEDEVRAAIAELQ